MKMESAMIWLIFYYMGLTIPWSCLISLSFAISLYFNQMSKLFDSACSTHFVAWRFCCWRIFSDGLQLNYEIFWTYCKQAFVILHFSMINLTLLLLNGPSCNSAISCFCYDSTFVLLILFFTSLYITKANLLLNLPFRADSTGCHSEGQFVFVAVDQLVITESMLPFTLCSELAKQKTHSLGKLRNIRIVFPPFSPNSQGNPINQSMEQLSILFKVLC